MITIVQWTRTYEHIDASALWRAVCGFSQQKITFTKHVSFTVVVNTLTRATLFVSALLELQLHWRRGGKKKTYEKNYYKQSIQLVGSWLAIKPDRTRSFFAWSLGVDVGAPARTNFAPFCSATASRSLRVAIDLYFKCECVNYSVAKWCESISSADWPLKRNLR